MLRKKPQIQKKKIDIYQKLEKVIETCGPQIFKFLKNLELKNLRQVNRLFYYQLMTLEIWNGLLDGIKQNQQQNEINRNKKQLTRIDEDEEDERYQKELENDKLKMKQYELEFEDDKEESDSDDESQKKPKKKTVIQRKHLERVSQSSVPQNNMREKVREQIQSVKKGDSIKEEEEQFEVTPQIKSKLITGKVQFQQRQIQEQSDNDMNKSLTQSQVKIIRRSSLMRDGKYSQTNTSVNNSVISTSISSSKREGSIDVKISNNQIAKDLEKSSQILQKKKDQFEQQQQIKNGNIFAIKPDSNNNDPLLRTSNSFFKKNFFDRLNQNSNQIVSNNSKTITNVSTNKLLGQGNFNPAATLQAGLRPSTNMQVRRGQDSQVINFDSLQWLKIPQNVIDNIDNLFDIKKSFAQNMKSFEELNQMMDSWIHETKRLEKALDAQSIQTDTLLQEVQLWPDLCRIIDMFKKECENEQIQKLEKLIIEKCFTDEGLKKKVGQFKQIKKNILIDRLSKKNFAHEFSLECSDQFKKLMKATFKEFPEIWVPCLSTIIQLYEKYTVAFDQRIFYVMEKIYYLLINKMKQCSISIQQAADVDNVEFVDTLINTFVHFSEQLIEGWKKITELSSKKESTTKIHEKMFQKKLLQLRSVLDDLVKLKSTFRKLEKQRKVLINCKKKNNDDQKKCSELASQIEKLLQFYSNQQTEFDIFDYSNKQQWDNILKQFKLKMEPIRNGIRLVKDDSHQKEFHPNLFLQNRNKNIQDGNKESNLQSTSKKIEQEKEYKQTEDEFMNNKSHLGIQGVEDDEGDNEEEFSNTGFSFHNPMYQTQVGWKID